MDYLPTYADSLKNRETNVIKEFFKLYTIANKNRIDDRSLFGYLSLVFEKLDKYSNEFICSYDCLNDILGNILEYEALSESESLNIDDNLLNNFNAIYRNYCTFMMDLITSYWNIYIIHDHAGYLSSQKNTINKFIKILNNGLRKLGYGINYDEEYCKFYVLNQKAEAIAHVCNKKDSNNIYNYLAATTLEEKQEILTILAIDAESIEDKYSSTSLIKDAKRYGQTLRHITSIDEKDPNYSWFFKNKEKGLDIIFDMILFVHDFDHAHNLSSAIKKNITESSKKGNTSAN